jgi:hypothetical protein
MTPLVAARPRRLAGTAVVLSLLAGGLMAAAAGGVSSPAATPSSGPAIAPGVVHAQDAVRLRKPSPIVLSAPKSVQAGARIRFDGDLVVKARKPRRVEVFERRAGRWRPVGRTTSKRNGTFALRIAAGSAGRIRVFRAEAAAVRGLAGLRTGTLRVRVTKAAAPTAGPVIPGGEGYDAAEGLPVGYVAAGSRSDWSYLFDRQPNAFGSRWDPCTVITWSYNPSGEAYNALPDLKRAFAKIAGVSGLRFLYGGNQVAYRYLGGEDDLDLMVEEMVVGWANANEFSDLRPDQYGDAVGIGGGSARPVAGADVDLKMVQGYLTLDNDPSIALARGFNGSGWGQVMMHEILHALGLGHATSANQLMHGTATPLNHRFGAGDITGMTKVGSASPCLP